MADVDLETRTLEQLGEATTASSLALVGVQEPGGPLKKMSVARLLGQLHKADVVYETKAELDADLEHDANEIGYVYADPAPGNSGYYRKTGASGAGGWELIGAEALELREDLAGGGDDLSSFVQAGDDPAVQTVRDKLRQATVHLMDKVPRGQWAAIEAGTSAYDASAAFANAAELGKRIILPAGKVLANVSGLPSGFTLEGEDRLHSIIRPHNVDARCFTFDSGAAGTFLSDIHFARLTFEGTVEDDDFSEHVHLLAMSGVTDVLLEDMRFRGFRGDGLILASGHTPGDERHNKRVAVRRCHFDGVNNDNRQCITIIDGVGILIDDCDFENSTRSSMPGAIDIEPDSTAFTELGDIIVSRNRFSNIGGNVGVLALVLPSIVPIPTGIAFIDNRFRDNPDSGCDIAVYTFRAPSATDPKLGMVIAGNHGRDGNRPFSIQGARGVKITGSHWQDYPSYANFGFTGATDFVRDMEISDSYLLRCGTGVFESALLISDSERLAVRNVVTDDCGSATVGGNGIRLHSGGESEHLTIERYRHVARANQTHAISAIGHTQNPDTARTADNDYGGLLSSVTAAGPGQLLKGSEAWNPPSVTPAATATIGIEVIGARVGDLVTLALSIDRGGLVLDGEVASDDEVTARLFQPDSSASGVDLGACTVTALVTKMPTV